MAGLSEKLTSLVKAADDPYVVFYAYTHLGIGLPVGDHDSLGFRRRVKEIRNHLITDWLQGDGPWEKMKREQEKAKREQQEIAELNRQEGQLALQLFQTSTLHVVARHLVSAKPEELRTHIVNKDPLLRFLTIRVIGGRHLHLESALIERLTDPDPVVGQTARAALIRVARGTDFGPIPGSSQRGIDRSVEKWRQWLALQESASPEKLAKDAAIAAAGQHPKAAPLDIVPLVLAHEEKPALSSAATKARDELVNAKGDEQTALLARLRDAQDDDSTDALVLAVPKLSGDIQQQTRDALTARLTRLSAAALRDKLQDDRLEMRCAAALACGRKIAREHIADLLQLLDDPEMEVVQSARVALTELTGEDFGPPNDTDGHGRGEAVAAWRKWWKEHQSRQK